MTDRRKAILVEAARDLAEMQEGSDAGWGLWYDWLDTVVRKVEREAGEVYTIGEITEWLESDGGQLRTMHSYDIEGEGEASRKPGDRVRVVKEAP